MRVVGLVCLVLLGALAWQARGQDEEEENTETYASALLEVKNFINNHLPKYPNVDVKYVGGRDPEMLFMNDSGEVVKRASVVSMNEDEINQLLNDHGFFKEEEPEPVPDSDDESKEEL